MNLIFLDIDGVLNHALYYHEKRQAIRYKEDGYPMCDIDTKKVNLLNQLCYETNSKVVISSTWRKGRSLFQMAHILGDRGFNGEIVGKTPVIYHDKLESHIPRGLEIQEYLYREYGYDYDEKVNYVILDDDSDMLYCQRDHYFNVDNYSGLSPNLVYKLKRYFRDKRVKG